MYTLKMNEHKELITTQVRKLYQGENLVDNLRFLIPQKYGEIDLTPYVATLICTNQDDAVWNEELCLAPENYNKTTLCYHLPVDSNLTKHSGDIRIRISLKNSDGNVLYSGESIIFVEPVFPEVSPDEPGGSFLPTENHTHDNKRQLDTYNNTQDELLDIAQSMAIECTEDVFESNITTLGEAKEYLNMEGV